MNRYSKNRVLLVSGSFTTRKMAEDALEAQGLEVLVAETGQSALRIMRERVIDVIILDHRTPFGRYDASTRKLKTLEAITDASPLLPLVLICSGTTELSYAASLMADMILKQPFDSSDLLATVENVLEETLRERAHRKAGVAAVFQ